MQDQPGSSQEPPALDWTPRQRQVLDLIARGKTNAEVAETLGISLDGAKWHVREILSKLGAGSREEAAAYWRRHTRPGATIGRALLALVSLPKVWWAGAAVAVTGAAIVVTSVVLGARQPGAAPAGDEPGATASAVAVSRVILTPTPQDSNCPKRTASPPGFIYSVAATGVKCLPGQHPELAHLDKGGCDFSGLDLRGLMVLSNMNFRGCNLAGTNLQGVAANDSDFSGANLSGAVLTGGSYANSIFTGAILRGVAASPGVFQGSVNFHNADLTGADLSDAIVPRSANAWSGAICPDGSLASQAPSGSCVGTPGLEDPPSTYSFADGYKPKPSATPRP
jgi:DNA-binding CsgD family transcriptional regulator